MSYMELPRLCFFGTFKAAPSTINNTITNYDTDAPANPLLWNPTGLAAFQLLQGSEITIPPGAAVVPTTIRSLQTSAGFITSGDPLIGQFVISTNQPSTGKLVDLDPDQQGVSQVWGMQIAIGTPGGEQVIGDYTAAYFQQMFIGSRTTLGRNIAIKGAQGASAAYQSLLTNLRWPESISSPFLSELKAASPDVLSIRFTVDLFNRTPPDPQTNPNFTLGRVTGAIGPATLSDPPFLNPRGRMLRPIPPKPPAAVAAAAAAEGGVAGLVSSGLAAIRESAERAALMKAESDAPPADTAVAEVAITAGAKPPTLTEFGFAPAIFDASRNTVVLDLANALQFNGPEPIEGPLTAAILTSNGPVPLGTIDNSLTNYQQRAFLFELPLTTGDAVKAVRSNPIVVQLSGETVMRENPTGAYVDATDHVVRLDANGSTSLSLVATIFGGPVGSGQKVTLGPVAPIDPDYPPDSIVTISPGTVTLDPSGSGSFTISVGNLLNPRKIIDGQVYVIPIDWRLDTYPDDDNAFISLLAFSALTDDSPTWANVQPIFQQFMHLYPGMQSILNLADEDTVKKNAQLIAAYLNEPITASAYMPVTRDLSNAKRTMILNYLNSI